MESKGVELGALQARVEALERQNRWMKRGGCAVLLSAILLLIALLWVKGQSRPSRIITTDLVLQDTQGHKLAELSTGKDSQPSLVLFNLDQGRKAKLSPDLFEFQEDKSKGTASLGIDGLYIYNNQGNEVVGLGGPSLFAADYFRL